MSTFPEYSGYGQVSEKKFLGIRYAKIFGFMFIALLITAAVAAGLGGLVTYLVSQGEATEDAGLSIFLIAIVAGGIGSIALSFVITFMYAHGKHSILVPGILYCVFMGVLLSSFAVFIPWTILSMAFGITALSFGLMALIGVFSKGNLNLLGYIGLGLLFGALAMSLFGFAFYLISPATFELYYIVIDFVVLAAMLLFVAFDMNKVKRYINSGAEEKNTELMCSFILYCDFIQIFIRIVYILLRAYSRNK